MKYEAGQIVVLGDLESPFCEKGIFVKGVKVKIKNLCDGPPEPHYTVCEIDNDNSVWWVTDDEIQGEYMKEFAKADLRTGDILKILYGSKEVHAKVYLNTENGDIVSGDTWFTLKDYSDEALFHSKRGCVHKIVEVHRPKIFNFFNHNEPHQSGHTLIWKRVEKSRAQIELETLQAQITALQEQAKRLESTIK